MNNNEIYRLIDRTLNSMKFDILPCVDYIQLMSIEWYVLQREDKYIIMIIYRRDILNKKYK